MKKFVCFLIAFALFTVPIIVHAEEVIAEVNVDQNGVVSSSAPDGSTESEVLPDDQASVFEPETDDPENKDETPTDPKEVTINAEQVTIVDNSEPEIEPYVVPDTPIQGGYYISAATSQLGDVKIYVPVNYKADSFTFTSGNVMSIQASTITGVMYASSGVYTIRFPSFSSPEYRTYDSGYTYADLSITDVYDTNIQILDSDPHLEVPQYIIQLAVILTLGVIIICLFMKR